MFAEELISTDIFPLKKTDTCENAILFMHDWKVFHLPVADSGKLLGYVTYDELKLPALSNLYNRCCSCISEKASICSISSGRWQRADLRASR
jgi:predicted transcriptional regulator